ncbi:hypothetical protein Glove_173g12 [Diversispora epigaea]|uniref:Palmitoyltransferase n=1 Tax=Diversispora epigaea TaxID=1348612 RepID=A0A397ITU9_9GLOM|nr:hypothetical protein Glove_173g12 [Diversispora epigaea]
MAAKKICRSILSLGKYLPVLSVLILIGWVYYAFVFRLCVYHILNENVIQGIIYLVIFNILCFLMVWCFFVATFTPAGSPYPIPTKSHPTKITPINNNNASLSSISIEKPKTDLLFLDEYGNYITSSDIILKKSGKKRFCQKCQCDKPDRTHHCSVCERCIMKMDHHCPWINNCIGFYNQKAFYLYIVWSTLFSIFITVAAILPAIEYYTTTSYESIPSLDLNISFLILAGGVFSIGLFGFLIYHTNLILNNRTTLESLKYGDKGENIFDLGKKANFIQVMGPTWYLWFFPIRNSSGDGKSWPVNYEKFNKLYNSETS